MPSVRLRWVIVAVVAAGATAVAYYVWYSANDDECTQVWNYQVGSGVETPEAALEAFGVDANDFDLTDSSESTRTFVDGSRTIRVSLLVSDGWAVTTDSKVIRC
jgi:hypothetical protein